jgi:hypothetical protein
MLDMSQSFSYKVRIAFDHTKRVSYSNNDITYVLKISSGNYGKGNGNMFALPTHNPIMILRDPP